MVNEKSTDIAKLSSTGSSFQVSIIIVNWNSVDYTRQCIKSIIDQTHEITYEVIVIDNASGDGCGEMLRNEFPRVVFIQSEVNDGFARANNRAYHRSQGETLLFLNPDTEIAGPAIPTMHQYLMSGDEAGAIGCTLRNGDGSLQTSCIQAYPTILNQMLDSAWLRKRFPRSALWGMAPLFAWTAPTAEVNVISGACVMVKRAVFEAVGLFSTDYFMYAEDVDLCHKIKTLNYRNYYTPEGSVVHFGGGSSTHAASEFSTWMKRESMWRFFVRTRGRGYGIGYRLGMIASSLCRLAIILPTVCLPKPDSGRLNPLNSFNKWMTVLKWGLKCKLLDSK